MKPSFLSCLTVWALLIAAPLTATPRICRSRDRPTLPRLFRRPVGPAAISAGTSVRLGLKKTTLSWNRFIKSLEHPLNTASGSGLAYGGQVGCDYQVNSAWVIGIRGMWDGTNVKGSASGYRTTWKAPRLISRVTPTQRLSLAWIPSNATMMLYGLGGVASVHDQYSLYSPENGGLTDKAAAGRRGGFRDRGGHSKLVWYFANAEPNRAKLHSAAPPASRNLAGKDGRGVLGRQ